MSALSWWDADWADLDWEDENPVLTPEVLTVAAGIGWWTDTSLLPDMDD